MTWTQEVLYRQRAEQGAAMLDRYQGGATAAMMPTGFGFVVGSRGPVTWPGLVDLPRLDLASQADDILGQLFGSYLRGVQALQAILWDGEPFRTSDCGFTLPDYEQHAPRDVVLPRFALLTDAWRDLIRARLAAAP